MPPADMNTLMAHMRQFDGLERSWALRKAFTLRTLKALADLYPPQDGRRPGKLRELVEQFELTQQSLLQGSGPQQQKSRGEYPALVREMQGTLRTNAEQMRWDSRLAALAEAYRADGPDHPALAAFPRVAQLAESAYETTLLEPLIHGLDDALAQPLYALKPATLRALDRFLTSGTKLDRRQPALFTTLLALTDPAVALTPAAVQDVRDRVTSYHDGIVRHYDGLLVNIYRKDMDDILHTKPEPNPFLGRSHVLDVVHKARWAQAAARIDLWLDRYAITLSDPTKQRDLGERGTLLDRLRARRDENRNNPFRS